ncbi:hypothetical protein BHE74_00050102 [Ensete ventricosum]|nr:hypothetical protein BHE74_00050102 [Ensete ventricosum]
MRKWSATNHNPCQRWWGGLVPWLLVMSTSSAPATHVGGCHSHLLRRGANAGGIEGVDTAETGRVNRLATSTTAGRQRSKGSSRQRRLQRTQPLCWDSMDAATGEATVADGRGESTAVEEGSSQVEKKASAKEVACKGKRAWQASECDGKAGVAGEQATGKQRVSRCCGLAGVVGERRATGAMASDKRQV